MLDILYRDQTLVAVNKPSGLLVHAADGERPDLVAALAAQLQADAVEFEAPLAPAHRLDIGASGIVLFGLKEDARRQLAGLFAAREVRKAYDAVVFGRTRGKGAVNRPLKRKRRPPQPARTKYRRIKFAGKHTLVRVWPDTGRAHQIRRHLAGIGHAIVGDARHGDTRMARQFHEEIGASRLMLHARSVSIAHPETGDALHIVASPDEVWERVVKSLGLTT